MADYLTDNARPFTQFPQMISPHQTLSAQFAFTKPSTPTRTVFDRLISDSDIRRKHANLKEGKPKMKFQRVVAKEKIEDKLMLKYEIQQTRLMHLKAVREAETLSIMQQVPSINPLSRELAMKHRERSNAYTNPLVSFRPAQSAVSPQAAAAKNYKQAAPPKILVKLDEDDSDEEEETPTKSAQHTPLESVLEADFEDEETPHPAKQPAYFQRDKIEQMKRHFKMKDCLMEPEAPMEFIQQEGSLSPDPALKENGASTARSTSRPDTGKGSRQALSYEDV
mmetsp:Transcript_6820/g.12332  ORF Transcript_6820/g.12332 Transcript_6820/m.12332 type:complete len:280 (+) Transcript_6820:331-1170(+)